MRCPYCGAEVNKKKCEYCDSDLSSLFTEQPGVNPGDTINVFNTIRQNTDFYRNLNDPEASDKSKITALILCVCSFFLPGLHRFYVGKVGTGLLWLFTLGCFWHIGTLVDLIMIATGKFTDSNGKYLKY